MLQERRLRTAAQRVDDFNGRNAVRANSKISQGVFLRTSASLLELARQVHSENSDMAPLAL